LLTFKNETKEMVEIQPSELRAEHLRKSFNNRDVVKDVSFAVKTGEIIGLLGPNGAGKTTSFYMVAGLIANDGGNIYLDDICINKFAIYRRARLGIGYLPQEPSIFRQLSVEDNIKAILQVKKFSKDKIMSETERLLEALSLTHIKKSLGFVLSGGERRRCEIARLLAGHPKFVLLDEPFAGVDPISISDIQNIIYLLKGFGIGIIITDHNVAATLKICDRGYIISEGTLIASGTAQELVDNKLVQQVYLGDNFSL
jgi:lipopolysaccharide export system ATP-binding protein